MGRQAEQMNMEQNETKHIDNIDNKEIDTNEARVQKTGSQTGPMTRDHERWDEFYDQLIGPEGCNFHLTDPNDRTSADWTCDSTDAFPISRRILREMRLTPDQIEQSIAYFRQLGACCDCEIFLNLDRLSLKKRVGVEAANERERNRLMKNENHEDNEAKCDGATRQNKTVVFDALAAAGITEVMVEFDGYGDSGQIQSIAAYTGDSEVELPTTSVTFHDVTRVWRAGHEEIIEKIEQQPIAQAVEGLCYAYLEKHHGGWEIDDGSFGHFEFAVATRTITLEFNQRESSVITDFHEF